MGVPVPLRSDYDGKALYALAKECGDASRMRRLLALALI